LIGTVQQAISSLLATQMPQFLGIGNRMFISFATILLVWQGIRMMLDWRESGEHVQLRQAVAHDRVRRRDDRLLCLADRGLASRSQA
jgi:hypothetical protein